MKFSEWSLLVARYCQTDEDAAAFSSGMREIQKVAYERALKMVITLADQDPDLGIHVVAREAWHRLTREES